MTALFQGWSKEELREKRREIEELYVSGVKSVDFDGESFDISTPEKLEHVVSRVNQAIRRKSGKKRRAFRRVPVTFGGSGMR